MASSYGGYLEINRLKNLIFVNDEKFLIYYKKTRAKGLLKFVAKYASMSAIVMIN